MLRGLVRRLRQLPNVRRALAPVRALQRRDASLAEWVELAMSFPRSGRIRVSTSQRPAEFLSLVEEVSALRPARILEIGTYHGGTLLVWSQLASEQVVSCDIRVRDHMRLVFERFAPPGSGCAVRILEGDSHAAAFRESVERELGGPVDFLFIDGDHTEQGVRLDFEMYRSLVRPGGLIAFHDIAERQPIPENQVQHFWRKLKADAPPGTVQEFIDDPDQSGFGIGLLRT